MAAYRKPSKGRKKKRNATRRGEIRSSPLILDLRDGKLSDSGKQEGSKTFHKLHVLGKDDDLWDGVRGLGSDTWKGCE